jgi:hypothetical protein
MNYRRRLRVLPAALLVFVALTGVSLPGWSDAPRRAGAAAAVLTPAAARAQAERVITTDLLRSYLTFIASDALQGRDTPSPGLDAAAQFLAFNLKRLGLKPMGDDGTYFQKIALRHVLPDGEKSRALLVGTPPLHFESDFLPELSGHRGGAGSVPESPLIYVSHGWVIPSRNIDAYKGVDVRDRVMVVAGRALPKGVQFYDLERGAARRGGWTGPAAYAAAHGARGIVYLPETEGGYADLVRSVRAEQGEIAPTDPAVASDETMREPASNAVPAIVLSWEVARRLFEGEPLSGDALLEDSETGEGSRAFMLRPEKRIAFTTAYRRDTVYTQNVVASLEGSGPVLREQYVAFGAHYDHVGVGLPDKNGDRIYNGADDDGSGTTALLTLAEAFSRADARPRRSLLFVWHCGEEKGLWGSSYFTAHPTVPLKQIVTQLNMDMIGRSKKQGDRERKNAELSGPDEIYVIGSRAMSTKLAAVSESVNRNYLDLKFNYKYDDPDDPNYFFYRSDHYNYARRGVPIIFYFDGEHADYHGRDDEVDRIDFDKMLKVTRTVFLTATELANLLDPPKVDKKMPFTG